MHEVREVLAQYYELSWTEIAVLILSGVTAFLTAFVFDSPVVFDCAFIVVVCTLLCGVFRMRTAVPTEKKGIVRGIAFVFGLLAAGIVALVLCGLVPQLAQISE